jgi:hypothetical protein
MDAPDLSLTCGERDEAYTDSELGKAFKALTERQDLPAGYCGTVKRKFAALAVRMNPELSRNNEELRQQQIDALRDFLWGGLDPVVRLFMPLLVERGPQMHPDHLEECLDVACSEVIIKGHKKLIRRFLEAKPVGLGELANDVYNKVSQKAKNDELRKRLKNNAAYGMRDIGLWNVPDVNDKKSKIGGSYHPGYNISAGPVLMAFHEQVWMPFTVYFNYLASSPPSPET